MDNVSLAVGITVITDKFHDLVNWVVSSLANRLCCLIITVSVNYTTPGVNLIKRLQVSYFLHVVESGNYSYTCKSFIYLTQDFKTENKLTWSVRKIHNKSLLFCYIMINFDFLNMRKQTALTVIGLQYDRCINIKCWIHIRQRHSYGFS